MPKEKLEKIAREYVVSLFPVATMLDAFAGPMKKRVGESCPLVIVLENNAVTYYIWPSKWHKAHKSLVAKIKNNYNFLKNTYKEIEKSGKRQVVATRHLVKKASAYNNQELNRYYQNFIVSNTELYSFGLVLSLLDFHDTTFISDELRAILKRNKADRYFNVLTSSRRDTFNKKQEIAILKVLLPITQNKKFIDRFKKEESSDLAGDLKKNAKKIWRMLKTHTRRYAWVYYVYEGPAADEIYFIDILKDYVKRGIDPTKELAKYRREKEDLRQKQTEIVKGLKSNNYEKQIIDIARDFVFFKAYRRELQTWSYYHMESLLKEIAKRLRLSIKQARMMLPEEVASALKTGKVNHNLLNDRLKLVVYGYKPEKFFLAGKSAKDFVKREIKAEEEIKMVNKLSGEVASPGKAKGEVAIINAPEDMKKMMAGNILVSFSTNPNLMPAIRQAAAIVTDEGGLTCHAAIVSRELGIPCVVGTKIATQVLEDGDRVRVDANAGIVRKL
ncbi:MAG: PEP-utilizing enzyme [Patescibacteria group bacterium]|nr:PEP-utilizing enzyme [Patescibacteria group bacterium]